MRVSADVLHMQAKAALTNEQLTRKRVDELEAWARSVSLILTGGLWRRAWWLLTGK